MKGLEEPIKEYSQEMDGGKHKLTDKDPERLFYLMGAMAMAKMLCMLEEMKEDGEKKGQSTMNGMADAFGKMMGGGSGMGMHDMMGAIGPLVLPGMDHQYNYDNYNRRGVPGTGTRNAMHPYGDDYDMENRRGVPGTGRRSTRSEYDEMDRMEGNDEMDDMENRHRSRRTGRFVKNESSDGDGVGPGKNKIGF